jgi:HK97 family phage portal protein
MSIFSGIFKRKQQREVTPANGGEAVSSDVKTAVETSVVGVSTSLIKVSGDGALNVMAYKRALNILAGSVARLPLRYMKQKDGIYVDFEASPLHYLLGTQPQSRMSAYDWKYQLVWRAFHDGDAYVWPRVIDGEVVELVLLSRQSCSFDDVNGTYYVTDEYNGVYGTFKENEILHILTNSLNGRRGTPLWKIGNRALNIMATGDNETLNRFVNGGNVRGFITNDKSVVGFGEYADEQLEQLAQTVREDFRNGVGITSLPGQAQFQQLSLSSTDMQFLETRKFAVLEISRLTGVPPIYLFDMVGGNYKVPEQADTAFLTQTLDGILLSIESEFNRKLVSCSMCCKRTFSFDRKRLFSMDLLSMANYESKMIQNGTFSINDVRRMENQPPVEGGDTIYLSTNTAVMGSSKMTGEKDDDNKNNE